MCVSLCVVVVVVAAAVFLVFSLLFFWLCCCFALFSVLTNYTKHEIIALHALEFY